MVRGAATEEGTCRFRARFPVAAEVGHFRRLGELWVSSIGFGTYLGEATEAVDRLYEESVLAALSRGCNVFDSAINYRHQRSERVLGRALARAFESGLARRDEVVVCTKGGFLPFDGAAPVDPEADLRRRFLDTELIGPDELAAGCHSLAVPFLRHQLAASQANLGLETVDLYYLHNPETQLGSIDADELATRLGRALEFLVEARSAGTIAGLGVATWSGFRVAPGSPGALRLETLHRQAGDGLLAVQAPVNIAMPEAVIAPTQAIGEVVVPLAVATRHFGLGLMASASILQGRVDAAASIGDTLGSGLTEVERALQFVRSLPGVTTALVGMASKEHVRENLALARLPPASPEAIQELFVH